MNDTSGDVATRIPTRSELTALVHLHLATLYDAGVGARLLEAFGTPEAALARARTVEGAVPGLTRRTVRKLLDPAMRRWAEKEVEEAERREIEIVAWGRPGYPSSLQPFPGMPLVLYRMPRARPGDAEPDAIGIVGSRRPSPYGLRQSRRFAGALSLRGLTVVSGLALGIDGEAHRAALDAGGRTMAVLGAGLGRIYPPEHRDLARRIARSGQGAILTEFPLEAVPRTFHFPMRNRVLSGLSSAILVVEAGERSGSLITVRHALDQGKTVYVVPGRVDRPEAIGCLRLLQDGATPAIEPEDILPGAGASPAPPRRGAERRSKLGGPLGDRLDALFAEEDAWHPDLIAERLGAPPAEVISELARLELEGRLERLPGGSYALGRREP